MADVVGIGCSLKRMFGGEYLEGYQTLHKPYSAIAQTSGVPSEFVFEERIAEACILLTVAQTPHTVTIEADLYRYHALCS